jgi:hypothetical protein
MFKCIYCEELNNYIDDLKICHSCYLTTYQELLNS